MMVTPGRPGEAHDPEVAIERSRAFPATPEAIPVVRRMITEVAPDPVMAATAELLISELASNAVRHARTPFEVRIWARATGLRAEVVDGSAALPVLGERSVDSEQGRGLRIVESLASAWGVDHRGGKKAVWFELGPLRPGDSPSTGTAV
jgi:anti-sigma regulatory factor (Ser/Thr protein kinase)